ncbi:MAG: Helix-turn-helix domain [Solirubrobacteraceae bacterium]|jgi:excisionase family DNA binding protein|nr:Helix-turn-helix domain [Solirubrobacteraceae bacterium]
MAARTSVPAAEPVKKRWTDVPGLAAYLSVSPWWVTRNVNERRIPFTKVGRHLRFDLDLIDAWLADRSFDPTDEPGSRRSGGTVREAGKA